MNETLHEVGKDLRVGCCRLCVGIGCGVSVESSRYLLGRHFLFYPWCVVLAVGEGKPCPDVA